MCSVFVREGKWRRNLKGILVWILTKICKRTGEGTKKGNKTGKCQIMKFEWPRGSRKVNLQG